MGNSLKTDDYNCSNYCQTQQGNNFNNNENAQINKSTNSSNDSLHNSDNNDIIAELLDSKVNSKYDAIEDLIKSLEQQVSLFDDKQSDTIDLKDKDDYIRKNFNIEIFLKSQAKKTETHLLTNEDLFFNMNNENMLYFLTVICNKVKQEYQAFIKPTEKMLLIANDIINKRIWLPHPPKEESWTIFMDFLKKQVPSYIEYAKELPGLDDFCQHDFMTILDNNLSLLFSLKFAKLFIENENYVIIENYHFSKEIIMDTFGPIAGDLIINFLGKLNQLNLKDGELSLLIPFVLTSLGNLNISHKV